MKTVLKNLLSRWFGKPEDVAKKNARIAEQITTSSAFLRLTPQDKILCLGKLIQNFDLNDTAAPSSLEQKLVALNLEMKRDIVKIFSEL